MGGMRSSAAIRVYLADGQFKTFLVNSKVTTKDFTDIVKEKLSQISTEDFTGFALFEALDHGKVVNQLSPSSKPYDIHTSWGETSGDANRFIFKRATEKVQPFQQSLAGKGLSGLITQSKETERDEPEREPPPEIIPSLPSAIRAAQKQQPSESGEDGNSDDTQSAPTAPAIPIFQFKGMSHPTKGKVSAGVSGKNPGEDISVPKSKKVMPNSGFDPTEILKKQRQVARGVGNKNSKSNDVNDKKRVQLESVIIWINSHLNDKGIKLTSDNLLEELHDGVILATLIETLTGKDNGSIKIFKNPKIPSHKLDNISRCFSILESDGVHVIGCTPQDFIDRNYNCVIGLLLLIIKRYKNVSQSANRRFSVRLQSSDRTTDTTTTTTITTTTGTSSQIQPVVNSSTTLPSKTTTWASGKKTTLSSNSGSGKMLLLNRQRDNSRATSSTTISVSTTTTTTITTAAPDIATSNNTNDTGSVASSLPEIPATQNIIEEKQPVTPFPSLPSSSIALTATPEIPQTKHDDQPNTVEDELASQLKELKQIAIQPDDSGGSSSLDSQSLEAKPIVIPSNDLLNLLDQLGPQVQKSFGTGKFHRDAVSHPSSESVFSDSTTTATTIASTSTTPITETTIIQSKYTIDNQRKSIPVPLMVSSIPDSIKDDEESIFIESSIPITTMPSLPFLLSSHKLSSPPIPPSDQIKSVIDTSDTIGTVDNNNNNDNNNNDTSVIDNNIDTLEKLTIELSDNDNNNNNINDNLSDDIKSIKLTEVDTSISDNSNDNNHNNNNNDNDNDNEVVIDKLTSDLSSDVKLIWKSININDDNNSIPTSTSIMDNVIINNNNNNNNNNNDNDDSVADTSTMMDDNTFDSLLSELASELGVRETKVEKANSEDLDDLLISIESSTTTTIKTKNEISEIDNQDNEEEKEEEEEEEDDDDIMEDVVMLD